MTVTCDVKMKLVAQPKKCNRNNARASQAEAWEARIFSLIIAERSG
jgi:hypothetical protein